MTEHELKSLSRMDLLEILLAQSREIESLRRQLEEARQQLENRTILLENTGSIAEAALQLNHVFDAAQAACVQYTENIRLRSEQLDEACAQKERETQKKCDRMVADAQRRAQAYWEQASRKVQELMEQSAGLKEYLSGDLRSKGSL